MIALLSALFGVFGYALVNYDILDNVRIIGVVVGAVGLMIGLSLTLKRIRKKLKKFVVLEDLLRTLASKFTLALICCIIASTGMPAFWAV